MLGAEGSCGGGPRRACGPQAGGVRRSPRVTHAARGNMQDSRGRRRRGPCYGAPCTGLRLLGFPCWTHMTPAHIPAHRTRYKHLPTVVLRLSDRVKVNMEVPGPSTLPPTRLACPHTPPCLPTPLHMHPTPHPAVHTHPPPTHAGQSVQHIDSLFAGNVLGHKSDIADGTLRPTEFRTFDNIVGDYYVAPAFLERVAVRNAECNNIVIHIYHF